MITTIHCNVIFAENGKWISFAVNELFTVNKNIYRLPLIDLFIIDRTIYC